MKNNSSERMFSGKKITLMGLGLLGRGLNDAKFLAESGAQLKVTDLKSADALLPTLKKLEKYSNIRYTLGQHRLEDFRGVDMVLKAAGVPLNSEFIAEARKHNIPVEMDESLFAKLAGGVKIVGVTGTRGKSTTTMMIFETLLAAKKKFKWKENIYLGGNMKGFATLPLLKKVKEGDIVVLELSSWQLQGFGEARISPHIAVFTNFFDDHLNYYNNDRDLYYNDKSYIYRNQKVGDYFIAPKEILQRAQDASPNLKTNFVIPQTLPHDWHLGVVGEHNVANAELARAACLALGVSEDVIQKSLAAFRGVEGRLEKIATYKGVAIYNDTNATSPEAFVSAVRALGKNKNMLIIMGGADKNHDVSTVLKEIPGVAKAVFLLSGKNTTGSDKIRPLLKKIDGLIVEDCETLQQACTAAIAHAERDDVIILCPVFASFGMFVNEYDRGEQFVKSIKKLTTQKKPVKKKVKKATQKKSVKRKK